MPYPRRVRRAPERAYIVVYNVVYELCRAFGGRFCGVPVTHGGEKKLFKYKMNEGAHSRKAEFGARAVVQLEHIFQIKRAGTAYKGFYF